MKTPDTHIRPAPDSGRIKPRFFESLKPLSVALAMGLAAGVPFLAGSASADTLVSGGTTTVTDPVDFDANAGTVTIDNTGTLYFVPGTQGPYAFSNNLVLAGTGGTINLRFQKNDTIFTFNGSVTSDPAATGPQTLAIATGVNNNGDREEVTFVSGIPDVFDASPLSLSVNFSTQSDSYSFVNLTGNNTFTGPISLVKGQSTIFGYLTIGGRGIGSAGNVYNVTPGTGTLNGGNYAGDISIGASTLLSYASSTDQTLSGVISGAGSLWKESTSVLTLTGVNTYTGNTTVKGGTLVLSNDGVTSFGALNFVVTDATSNKVTGAGTATLDGTFTIDTTAVTVPTGSWTLVDTTTKSFGSNFNVVGFDDNDLDDIWTKEDGSVIWTFTEATGVLSIETLALMTSFGIPGSDGVIVQGDPGSISLVVPYLTDLDTLAPNFTVTSGVVTANGNPVSSGSPPSPTFDVTNPATYTVTDGAAVSSYVVTVTVLGFFPTPSSPPVTSDMAVWLTADNVNPDDPGQTRVSGGDTFVKQWKDLSGNSNNALNSTESQQPKYIASSLNGKPVVRFAQVDDNNGSRLFLGDLSAQFGGPVSDTYPTAVNSGTGGAGLNGTYSNTPARGIAGALIADSDTAMSTTASNQFMLLPYNAALMQPGSFSGEAWIKPSTIAVPGGLQCVLANGQFGNPRSGWLVYQNNDAYQLRLYDGATQVQVITLDSKVGDPVNGVLVAGNWYHLAVTFDSGTNTASIYVNGVLCNSGSPATAYVEGQSGGTSVGARSDGAFGNAGVYDEAAFYNTALSAARVLAHYQNGINPTPSQAYDLEIAADSPVAYYRLNEPAGPAAGAQAATIFAVTTLDNDLQYSVFGNRNNDERWVGGNYSEVTPGAFRSGRANFPGTYAQMPHTGSHIFAYESSTSAYRFLLNGTEIGTTTGEYNTGSGLNWVVGNNAANNGAQLKGDIAELIIYNRVLTTEEATQVGAYLSNKYGLTTEYMNDYDTWANGYLPDNVSDAAGDFDNDGLTNQEEYAFGLDPTSGASVSPITQQLDKGTGIFKYKRRATPVETGLTYIYEWSTTLVGAWGTFTPVTDPPASDSGTPVEEITIEVPAALLANPTLFVRVRAE